MTRLSIHEARQLGIIPGKPLQQKQKPIQVSLARWDAKTLPGGLWLQTPFVPPSLNVWKNWHYMKQHRYKQDLIQAVRLLALAARLPRFERAVVQFVYYHAEKRRRDPADNYAPKFLMDALVASGILADDNGDLVKVPPVDMRVDKERPRTEIFIWGY